MKDSVTRRPSIVIIKKYVPRGRFSVTSESWLVPLCTLKLAFSNCDFTEEVNLSVQFFDKKSILQFQKVTFHKKIQLSCQAGTVIFYQCTITNGLILEGQATEVTFMGQLTDVPNIKGEIQLRGEFRNIFLGNLLFDQSREDTRLRLDGITIHGNTTARGVSLVRATFFETIFKGIVDFSKCAFIWPTLVDLNEYKSSFLKTVFEKQVVFSDSFSGLLLFDRCHLKQPTRFESFFTDSQTKIKFKDCTFNGLVFFQCRIQSLAIQSSEFLGKLIMTKVVIIEHNIAFCLFNHDPDLVISTY